MAVCVLPIHSRRPFVTAPEPQHDFDDLKWFRAAYRISRWFGLSNSRRWGRREHQATSVDQRASVCARLSGYGCSTPLHAMVWATSW